MFENYWPFPFSHVTDGFVQPSSVLWLRFMRVRTTSPATRFLLGNQNVLVFLDVHYIQRISLGDLKEVAEHFLGIFLRNLATWALILVFLETLKFVIKLFKLFVLSRHWNPRSLPQNEHFIGNSHEWFPQFCRYLHAQFMPTLLSVLGRDELRLQRIIESKRISVE